MSTNLSIAQQYGFSASQKEPADMVMIEQSKAMHEIQAAMIIAKKFPRDVNKCFTNIMKACERPMLAEEALYAYSKGTKIVKGSSIRLAEVMAQNWGNMIFGVEEISQEKNVSVALAYAWDLETNLIVKKKFHVPHIRYTTNGSYPLKDSRDIYELVANNGARRVRACILAAIPKDIEEAAVKQVEKTLASGEEPIADRIRKMVVAFQDYGVSIEHLEKRLGHKLEATIETEIVTLKAIYKSLKDGFAKREDYFDISNNAESKLDELIKNKVKKAKKIESSEAVDVSEQQEISAEAKEFFGE